MKLGLRVVATFTDAGVSGTVLLERRPGLADALEALGRGDVLIVAKRDRIARDPFVTLVIEHKMRRSEARRR